MAVKQCPSCGKKIAEQASYCIYCSARFEDSDFDIHDDTSVIPNVNTTEDHTCIEETPRKRTALKWLLIMIPTLVVLAVVTVLLICFLPREDNAAEPTEIPTTTTTRNPERDAWLQEYTGRWVDEASVEKRSISEQGGSMLFIHEIQRDIVEFDLLYYSGGDISQIASISGIRAIMAEDTLHFEFDNDTQGHSGEGYLRFRDGEIDLEVLIDGEDALGENEHSLAMNTVFMRMNLPKSNGVDLRSLQTLEAVKEAAGEQTAEPVTDEATKQKTYSFGALSVVTAEDDSLLSVSLDYRALDDKTAYCFECVDGTMDYQTVKNYFGEAVQDYVEQPTNIRVLYYAFDDEETETQFTFDAQDNMLIKILYHQLISEGETTTSPSATATTTTAASVS